MQPDHQPRRQPGRHFGVKAAEGFIEAPPVDSIQPNRANSSTHDRSMLIAADCGTCTLRLEWRRMSLEAAIDQLSTPK